MKQLASMSVCVILLFTSKTYAQQNEPFNAEKEVKEVRGYVIHLMPAPGHTFGFTVVKDKKAIWFQANNPFVQTASQGFKTRQDAYALAEWIVSEKEKSSLSPITLKPELAAQLHISADNQPK